MAAVGFRHKPRQKHDFVDVHEKGDTLAYAHQPVYTAKMQEAQVERPFMDSSFSSATM
jgi:hypothetical protein